MRTKAKKILVIGGAGYVGCVLVEELLKRGYAVKVFDRLIYGDQGLRDVRDRVEVVVGDMRAMEPASLRGRGGGGQSGRHLQRSRPPSSIPTPTTR